ncbi:MAG: hypothetical protein E7317_04100 [Clostridiales bacterium]|nr:hypothetical protein [Clostridiales bacterium]
MRTIRTLFALAIALGLLLCTASAEGGDYLGRWAAEGYALTIERDPDADDAYVCTVTQPLTDDTAMRWTYAGCLYDEVSGGLSSFEVGTLAECTYDGEAYVEGDPVFTDGAAAFVFDEAGDVVWTDYKGTPGENEVAFARAVPDAQAFVEGYFSVVGGIEQGTAGASLKLAGAAADVLDFAVANRLDAADVNALRANMLEGWEGMTDEERAAFDASFMDVVAALDACTDDWEAEKGAFEDADAAGRMEALLSDPASEAAWQALRDHTLTMGNSDGEEDEEGEEASPDGLHASIQRRVDSPEWVKALAQAQDESVTQLFVVAGYGMDKSSASISMHERDQDGSWKQILSTPGLVGRNGLCLDADHAEGCGQTPVGTYRFNAAFGIAGDPGCAIPYTQVDDDIYWSGDQDRRYNEMVSITDYPDLDMENSEHIIDYEYEYQYCLNISFNEDGTAGRGSAIFLHCLGKAKPYTGGCVAIPENIMLQVMRNVREDCVVVIDTMENMNVTF